MIEDFSIKMHDPKEPDDARTWHAMDIYVFGNGQQNSPPRKYHFEADQLEWWPITLNYLAGTQYGSIDRQIDLYTIDGTKITDPLQLKNEHAYVAVQRPDNFIDAGYYKYLVRATKSWEKSQSKRGVNNNNNNNDDVVTTKTDGAKLEIPTESSNVKVDQSVDRTPEDSVLIHMAAERHSVDKSGSTIKVTPGMIEKRKESIKTNDSKRSSIQTPIIRRLSSQSSPSSSKRPSIKRKESVKLGNVEITGQVNDKKVPTKLSSSSNQLEGIISSKSKLSKGNIKSTIPSPVLPKVVEDVNEQNISLVEKNSNFDDKNYITASKVAVRKSFETLKVQPELKKEQSTSSNISSLKNIETESVKENLVEMFKDSKNFRIDSIATTSDRETMHQYDDRSAIPMRDDAEVPMNLDPTSPVIGSENVKEITGEKILEDKGLTATNKDDIVIKLHLDIWYHNKDPTRTAVSANCTQYNITKQKESEANVPDETISCNKSLPACAATSMDVGRDGQSVIIVKCLSRSFNEETQNSESSSKNSNNKGFIFFLPILQLDEIEKITECHCPAECELNSRQTKLSNTKYPVRRTTSCLSLLQTMSGFRNGEEAICSNALNQSKEPKLSRGSIAKKKSVVLHRDFVCGRIQCAPSILTEPTNTEIVLVEQATDILLPMKTVENSTQTEWCNLMMEARQQSDGHYAFFLPSLETLKKYKLHVY